MSRPVISVAQMRAWEQASWAAGLSESAVIARVGQLVARRVVELTRPGQRVLLLAGKGHNGDDVRAAQPHLTERRVDLLHVQDPVADLPRLEALLAARPAWVLDGLFGIGLNRPLDAAWCAFVQRINDSQLPVLAVDVGACRELVGGELGCRCLAGVFRVEAMVESLVGFRGRLVDRGALAERHRGRTWRTMAEELLG